ncbi:MAG: TIGR04053 family radical SAM/SPASM domain-containing protein [Deltaproteobacteria bacterium]|nr:TIGR04053 family radical SAM/SPASM domain-containing protein [Deltaproteobacteria bacterium]
MDTRPLTTRAVPQRATLDFEDHPLLVIWEVTQACDLVCQHCRACAKPSRDPDELTTEEGFRVLDQVAAMGTPLVVLTGGDPARRPDLVELVAHGTARGLSMAVTPSGTPTMTRELLGRLRDAGLSRLAVSVDGADAGTHDAFRGVSGSFQESLRILEDARSLGVERQVNSTLGPHNHGQLRALTELVTSVGAVLWSVFVVVPTGRAGASLLFGARHLEGALGELAELAEGAPFDVKTTAAPHYRRVLLQRHGERSRGILRDVDEHGVVKGMRGINDGLGFLFVSHLGALYPSGFLPLSAGNVRTDDLATVYREHPLFRQLRDPGQLHGRCGRCPFRRVCGGSRARAWAMTGDLGAEDPLCAYVPRDASAAPAE